MGKKKEKERGRSSLFGRPACAGKTKSWAKQRAASPFCPPVNNPEWARPTGWRRGASRALCIVGNLVFLPDCLDTQSGRLLWTQHRIHKTSPPCWPRSGPMRYDIAAVGPELHCEGRNSVRSLSSDFDFSFRQISGLATQLGDLHRNCSGRGDFLFRGLEADACQQRMQRLNHLRCCTALQDDG